MRRWSWIAVIVVGAALFEISRRVLLETQNPNLVPSIILLGAMVAPAAFVAFVSTRRLAFGVNTGTVALIGYVGGVVGVLTAGVLEFDALRRLGVLPMLGVGAIEEAAKLIAPLAVCCSPGTGWPPTACWSAWRPGPASPPWRRWATASSCCSSRAATSPSSPTCCSSGASPARQRTWPGPD